MTLQKYSGQPLKKSKVVFKEAEHEYWLENKELFGITSLINERLYGGKKYDGVPKFVLERAREIGSLIHKEIEKYYKNGESGFTQELTNFIVLQEVHGFKVIENEFTVDCGDRATNIDIVLDWNGLTLCDIKTTASLDIDYLKWQLSLNAFMFEQQTGIQVDKLIAYWTRTNELVEIERIPNEDVEKFLNDDYWTKQIQIFDTTKQQIFEQIQLEIQSQKALLKQLQIQEEQMNAEIMDAMKNNNIKSYDMGEIKITYIAPTTRENLDSKALKSELPEIYEKYKKQIDVKEQLKITIREK